MRLDDNLDYFSGMKDKIYDDAQILIAYYWRKKLKRIRIRNAKGSESKPKTHTKKKGVQSKVKPYIEGKVPGSSSKQRTTGYSGSDKSYGRLRANESSSGRTN